MHDTNDKWVRRFTTDSTSKHKNGFTIYKITSYLFPLASPEDVTVVTVWKRYSELQKLQKNMKKMHQDLYLKGTCPVYTKWGYFRRFDPETIEDRRMCTQALLEFVALHPPLFTSTEFVKFFQSSYTDPSGDENIAPSNIEAIRSSLLLPTEVIGPLEYQSSEDDSLSTADSPSVSTMESLDSSHHRNFSAHSNIIKPTSSNRKRSLSPLESTGTVENMADVLLLHDPLRAETISPPANKTSNEISNADLLSNTSKPNLPDLIAFDNKSNMDISQISTDSSIDSLSFLDSISNSVNLNSSTNNIEVIDKLNNTADADDLSVSLTQSVANFLENHNEHVAHDNASITTNESNQSVLESSSQYANGHSEKGVQSKDNADGCVSSNRSSSRMDMSVDSIFGSSADLKAESYVFEAGYLLSLGARHEARGDYQKAFDFYKAGIEKMLIGAQDDTNDFRKQFVKDKTNKYLSYAEKIYANYLNNPESEFTLESMANSSAIQRPKAAVRHCGASSMCRPYEDLSKYRVLGIIGGQVMLVLCSESQQCYAMKVIQKTCNQVPDEDYFMRPNVDNKLPIMPVEIPYMVKLIAYIETPNLLFLVLQYASGGKLFDYIKNYVRTIPDTPVREVNLENVFIDPEEFLKNSRTTSRDNSKTGQGTTERIEYNKNLSDRKECNKDGFNADLDADQLKNNSGLSIQDIVVNSQRLLLNVDDALSGNYRQVNERKGNIVSDLRNEIGVCDKNTVQSDKLDLKASAVERAFDGLQDKLEQIILEDDICKLNVLSNRSALPPKSLCNWAAELLIAIDHLHQCGVICRNLNPNNLLLGERGHLMLSYIVGRESQQALVTLLNEDRLQGDCYVAPELQRFPLLDPCDEKVGDFWSYGAILYELMEGMPLSIYHPSGFNSHTILNMPKDLPKDAESLLSQLLCFDPRERLGGGAGGINEIKSHPYFAHVDWHMLEEDFKYEAKD